MANPTAIKTLIEPLGFQLDDPNISFDPLVAAVWSDSLRTACRSACDLAERTYPPDLQAPASGLGTR